MSDLRPCRSGDQLGRPAEDLLHPLGTRRDKLDPVELVRDTQPLQSRLAGLARNTTLNRQAAPAVAVLSA